MLQQFFLQLFNKNQIIVLQPWTNVGILSDFPTTFNKNVLAFRSLFTPTFPVCNVFAN